MSSSSIFSPHSQDAERWVDHCSARLHEGAGGSTTLSEFFERIDQLNEEADERGQEILGALYDYAEQIAPPLREGASAARPPEGARPEVRSTEDS